MKGEFRKNIANWIFKVIISNQVFTSQIPAGLLPVVLQPSGTPPHTFPPLPSGWSGEAVWRKKQTASRWRSPCAHRPCRHYQLALLPPLEHSSLPSLLLASNQIKGIVIINNIKECNINIILTQTGYYCLFGNQFQSVYSLMTFILKLYFLEGEGALIFQLYKIKQEY